jgi:NUDIX domain
MWRSLPGAGVLVMKHGRVLIVRRERSGRYRWELPSGLVDASETCEQAAEREAFDVQMPNSEVSLYLCLSVTRRGTERNHTAVPPGW